MGKEGQLWDDSALINAFDHAISTYKKMHGKEFKDKSIIDASADVSSKNLDDSVKDISDQETVGNGDNSGSHTSVDVQEAGNSGTITETTVTDSQVTEEHALKSNPVPLPDQSHNYSSSTDLDEYNKLYKQYYEIEEQRQKILQQMQYLSNVNYSYSGEASTSDMQWGTNSATQDYQCTSRTPCGAMVVSCCPCASQCSVTCCSSLSCPTAGTLTAGPPSSKGFEEKPTVESVDFVATALGAAERALSTLKDNTAEESKLCNVMVQNASSETDLSTVLNAWYSAGFYTGKYLTEKSHTRTQPE